VSKLQNENWALKVSLHHSREKQSELENRLEALEKQLGEYEDLKTANDQLVTELQKRDEAVDEAVTVIVRLEHRLDELTRERSSTVRSFDSHTSFHEGDRNNGASYEDLGSIHSSPPYKSRTNGNHHGITTDLKYRQSVKSMARMPSFLSDDAEDTEALRSYYLGQDQTSLPRMSDLNSAPGDDPAELGEMQSPSLSVLSESSFLSVYGQRTPAEDVESLDLEDGAATPPAIRAHERKASIDHWLDSGDLGQSRQVKPTTQRKSSGVSPGQFLSLNDVITSPPQRMDRLKRRLEKRQQRLGADQAYQPTPQTKTNKRNPLPELDTARYPQMALKHRQPRALPPTPDTFSTNTLELGKASNDSLGSFTGNTMDREAFRAPHGKLHLHRSNTDPVFANPYLRRARSAETITSQRKGHGLDTATQSEVTDDTSSIGGSDKTSTIDKGWADNRGRTSRLAAFDPPDMFSFSNYERTDFSPDMLFEQVTGPVASRVRKKHDLNSSSHSPSVGYQGALQRSASAYPGQVQTVDAVQPRTGATTSLAYPNPPDRRSSLAASPSGNEKRLRRLQAAQRAAVEEARYRQDLPSLQVESREARPPNEAEPPRRGLLSRLGIGRSVSSQLPSSHGSQQNALSRQPSFDPHMDSATPPPIARYPRATSSTRAHDVRRPSTAHSMDSHAAAPQTFGQRRERRQSYNYPNSSDNSFDPRNEVRDLASKTGQEEDHGARETASMKNRKWYALGRATSMRR
jgi:hypothetical protein